MMFMILSNVSQANDVYFRTFSVSLQDRQSAVLNLVFDKKHNVFSFSHAVISCRTIWRHKICGKHQVAEKRLFDLVKSSALAVFQKIIGGAISLHSLPSYQGYILCFGPIKNAWWASFWGSCQKNEEVLWIGWTAMEMPLHLNGRSSYKSHSWRLYQPLVAPSPMLWFNHCRPCWRRWLRRDC